MEILKEITEWNCDFTVHNHTYLLDNKSRVVAYAITHGTDVVKLKTGFTLDKRYRKFIKSNHEGLLQISKSFPEEKKESKKQEVVKKENVRVFNVKSSEKIYRVEYNTEGDFYSCSCVGFGYRGKCKHVEGVKGFIK